MVFSQRKVYVWDRNGRLYDEVHLPTPEEVNAKKVSSRELEINQLPQAIGRMGAAYAHGS